MIGIDTKKYWENTIKYQNYEITIQKSAVKSTKADYVQQLSK